MAEEVELVRDVYDASYRRLVRQLLGVTGTQAEAEDVVQEAFVRAVDHPGRLSRVDNPEAWLRTVALNVYRSRWRRLRRLAGLGPLLAGSEGRDHRDTSGHDDTADRLTLLAALRTLPTAQREAIALHHLADLPVAEVAATLGLPVGTVKARLSRGRAALAHVLREHGDTPVVANGGTSRA